MAEKVGVIGLGVMGSAMAANLVAAGHEVTGFDIDPDRFARFTGDGGIPLGSAGAVAAAADFVVFSLPTATTLLDVASQVAAEGKEGLLCLETGTFALDTKALAHDILRSAGVELMDAPVSGTGLQAEDASLVVMASGSRQGFERAQPVFEAIGRAAHYLGEFGNGSRMKFIANLLVAVHNLATAEAHALGIGAGLDPAQVQAVVEDGVGSSRIFEIRGPMMVAGQYAPPSGRLDLILKDARIVKDFAADLGVPTPLLDAALPVYAECREAGLGDLDAAALCWHLETTGGLERR